MEPWKSWVIFGVVGAGAAYYYSQSGKSKRGTDRNTLLPAEQSQGRPLDSRNESKDGRKKKGKGKPSDGSDRAASDATEASSASNTPGITDQIKKRKGSKKQPSKLAQSSGNDVGNEPEVDADVINGEDEELSNREFAKQLSGLKTATSLKKPETSSKETKKTRKQGKSKELPTDATNGAALKPNGAVTAKDMSTASSTTGADADDDLSMPVSPELGATQVTTPSGGDVSDMLEAPAKGPAVLRVTQPASPHPSRQVKPKKANPEPETKKQRQNRQKNEEKKALREQSEKERHALLEKQLRTAREAEGRPAKNGTGVSKTPSASAWDKSTAPAASPIASQGAGPAKSDVGPLLDTFDEDKSFLGGTTPQPNVGASDPSKEGKKTWGGDVPSEEEQMRLISEMDSDNTWNTVGKGKGKKKSNRVTPADSAKQPTASGSSKNIPSSDDKYTSLRENISSSHDIIPSADPNFNRTSMSSSTDDITSVSSKMSSDDSNAISTGHNDPSKHPLSHETTASGLKDGHRPSGLAETKADITTSLVTSTKVDLKAGAAGHATDDHHNDKGDHQVHYKSPYHDGVPSHVSEHWRTVAKRLDREVWNYDNIHNHPDYNEYWPYALTGHHLDSDWAGDWDSDDMRKGNEKRAKEEVVTKVAEKAERQARKGKELDT